MHLNRISKAVSIKSKSTQTATQSLQQVSIQHDRTIKSINTQNQRTTDRLTVIRWGTTNNIYPITDISGRLLTNSNTLLSRNSYIPIIMYTMFTFKTWTRAMRYLTITSITISPHICMRYPVSLIFTVLQVKIYNQTSIKSLKRFVEHQWSQYLTPTD